MATACFLPSHFDRSQKRTRPSAGELPKAASLTPLFARETNDGGGARLRLSAKFHCVLLIRIPLIPAQAGIQCWVPAFAGTSGVLCSRMVEDSPRIE